MPLFPGINRILWLFKVGECYKFINDNFLSAFHYSNGFLLRRHKMIASENILFRRNVAIRFLNHGFTPVAIIITPTSGLLPRSSSEAKSENFNRTILVN
jgi:hypothetical protein